MFDDLAIVLAVILCASAVKIFDDWLDQTQDESGGQLNLAAVLGPGATIYAALLLAIAAAVNANLCLALFFASYSVGMFNDLGRVLPSRLKGWQEIVAVCALGAATLGWRLMLFSLLFIAAVQLVDDVIDREIDRQGGQRNLAERFGSVECLLAGLAFLLGACFLDGGLFPPVVAGTFLFYGGLLAFTGGKPPWS